MRLIDADAFKEYIDKYISVFGRYDLRDIKMFINEQPTIDAEPIRYGRWSPDCVCSECGEVPRSGMEENYCPNCGAKMGRHGMSNIEHYFENLLYDGHDVKSNCNKNSLTAEQQQVVEICAQYVIFSLFGTRDVFKKWISDRLVTINCDAKNG